MYSLALYSESMFQHVIISRYFMANSIVSIRFKDIKDSLEIQIIYCILGEITLWTMVMTQRLREAIFGTRCTSFRNWEEKTGCYGNSAFRH